MICRLGVAVAVVVMCAACATGQRETGSRAAAASFLEAVGDGQTRDACALLAADTREELEYSEGEPCAAALESVELGGGTVQEVTVWGDRARARASAGTLFLVEFDAGWRIAAAGCTPAAAGTYDCLLAA